jgi:hypothetical protein
MTQISLGKIPQQMRQCNAVISEHKHTEIVIVKNKFWGSTRNIKGRPRFRTNVAGHVIIATSHAKIRVRMIMDSIGKKAHQRFTALRLRSFQMLKGLKNVRKSMKILTLPTDAPRSVIIAAKVFMMSFVFCVDEIFGSKYTTNHIVK